MANDALCATALPASDKATATPGWPTATPRLASLLGQPLAIGNKIAPNRLWLAPLAGLGHTPFRELVTSYGVRPLLFTGMCSARAVPTENPARSAVFSWREEELPHLVCQLFGADPTDMAEAARRVEAEGFFGVDINMGCSVSALVKRGCGADLLRDTERALRMVDAMRKAVSIPLFVKFRTGWTPDPQPAAALAKQFEAAGVDCLVFHPRVAPDRRTHPARRDHIRVISEAVSIPVMGNGDVFGPDDAEAMLNATGCAGVSIGRIGVARPWVFASWMGQLDDDPARNPDLWRETPLRMLALLERHIAEPTRVVKMFRKFILYYAANFSFGNTLYGRCMRGESVEQLRSDLHEVFGALPQVAARPGMLLFTM